MSDIDLGALIGTHRRHGRLATMTVVRPNSPGGWRPSTDDHRVSGFAEKPRLDQWINGGFLCLEPGFLAYVDESSVLEREPLSRAADDGELHAYRHTGFWDCMDTYKDAIVLNDLWDAGRGPLGGLGARAGRRSRCLTPLWSRARAGSRERGWRRRCSTAGTRSVSLDRGREERSASTLSLLGIEGEVEDVRGDLGDQAALERLLREREIDSVFHLAAETIVGTVQASPVRGFETNVRGTWTLLEACRSVGTERVVVASSDKAYGSHAELPYREDFALLATAPYEASKAAADIIARSYWHSYGLPGGGDPLREHLRRRPTSTSPASMPEAVCAALDGRAPVLRSDGSPERDFLYVEDATAAYLAIADHLDRDEVRGEAFNAGGGRPHRIGEVVELIARLSGSNVQPEVRGDGNPEGEIDRQWVDAAKLRERCGWAPAVGLEEGIGRTLEWYRAHPQARP